MGQKAHPIGMRIGIIRTWPSRWYAKGTDYIEFLHEDIKVRKYIKEKITNAEISHIDIERPSASKVKVVINTARPGVVVGKQGSEINKLKDELSKQTGKQVLLYINEVKNTSEFAQLVAENVAGQLMRRVAFRRAMKRSIGKVMMDGMKGIKIACSGRLGGAEIARTEWYREGRVPMQTLRADVDYGFAEAKTSYGLIGIKVWLYRGDVLDKEYVNYSTEPRNEEASNRNTRKAPRRTK
ncbi:MAG: 30S ribosomal protein S3 [Candidatus Muirbacterium halophilum]|nr:30S ribosomal protein S3 [Candidatus Muirbacterium halophilum]MCK9475251.1 30S ribosomal protein S3 [Candidatus Muirbacterium halophilum]